MSAEFSLEDEGSGLSAHWGLDPEVVFLNHGSFGACPTAVLERQAELRAQLEREPVRFFVRDAHALWDDARERCAAFVRANPAGFAFVPNATTGVNAVLRSLRLEPGDELLATDHTYNACRNALDFVAERAGAKVVVAPLPFPLEDPGAVIEAILDAATDRTRLALVDHITSPTGLVLPLADIVEALKSRGIETLVDGAHAPGMVPLDVGALGAAYYTGNFHKWVCAPKGAAFLHVRDDLRGSVRPTTISHGANAKVDPDVRFRHEFDWVGTVDPTAALCVPTAIDFIGGLLEGGWDAVRNRNRTLALRGRDLVLEALGQPAPAPDAMIGTLAAIPLPSAGPIERPNTHTQTDPLQDRLWFEHRIEIPVFPWWALGQKVIRLSAHLHNSESQYVRLAAALKAELSATSG